MSAFIRRTVWFFAIACLFGYSTYLLVGSRSEAAAEPALMIRDEVARGAHHLSGTINVPSWCYQLSMQTKQISAIVYALHFRTWLEPAVGCQTGEVPRHFETIVFAPSAGIQIIATIDGKSLPIIVAPVKSATST